MIADPPREDTAHTMRKLGELGVSIKMITGDHANIAKETAKLIGLGTFIVPRRHLGAHSEARNQLIERADGFAEVCVCMYTGWMGRRGRMNGILQR